MGRIIVVDTETGGLNPNEHSILSLGAVLFPFTGRAEEQYEVKIQEENVVAHPAALAVNKIDLVEHAKDAVAPDVAAEGFRAWVRKVAGPGRHTFCAHNTPFDDGFVRRMYALAGQSDVLDALFSYRQLDTITCAQFMMLSGKLKNGACSLKALCAQFDIEIGTHHTALPDAIAACKLLGALINENAR